jgi:hypothetical protein
VEGIGKNGHAFTFRLGQDVDCGGALEGVGTFEDIRELKRLLVNDEERLARNLLSRFIVYATGAPVSFADRAELDEMLEHARKQAWGVRTLIHQVVQSDLFLHK